MPQQRILKGVSDDLKTFWVEILEDEGGTIVSETQDADQTWTLVASFPDVPIGGVSGEPQAVATAAREAVPPVTARDQAIDTMARTLWGEARGESMVGLEAVASVIVNRACREAGFWWGDTIESVCLKPFQFSCWNVGDPNRAPMLAVTSADPDFARCLAVARRAIDGEITDRTDGATHYHTAAVQPDWSAGITPSAKIGTHLFFNTIV